MGGERSEPRFSQRYPPPQFCRPLGEKSALFLFGPDGYINSEDHSTDLIAGTSMRAKMRSNSFMNFALYLRTAELILPPGRQRSRGLQWLS